MNRTKKETIHAILLLIGLITIHLTFFKNNLPGEFSLPFFIMAGYGLYFLIFGIISLFKRKSAQLFVSLCLLVLLVFPTLKTQWEYYNFILHGLVILISTAVAFRSNSTLRFVPFLKLFTLVNLAFFVTPGYDIVRYYQKDTERTIWRELTWNDFQVVRDSSDYFDASIRSTISAKINMVHNYPPALVIGYMIPFESTKKESELSDKLLKHEQGHFDLTELARRSTQDTLNTLWGTSPKDILGGIELKRDELRKNQRLYDWSTEHGTNLEIQKIFNQSFDEQLRKR